MTAWCENATTGVLRRTGGVQGWPSRGRGTGKAPGGWSQLYLCVVTCVTVTAHWPDWKGQGGRGQCHSRVEQAPGKSNCCPGLRLQPAPWDHPGPLWPSVPPVLPSVMTALGKTVSPTSHPLPHSPQAWPDPDHQGSPPSLQ